MFVRKDVSCFIIFIELNQNTSSIQTHAMTKCTNYADEAHVKKNVWQKKVNNPLLKYKQNKIVFAVNCINNNKDRNKCCKHD